MNVLGGVDATTKHHRQIDPPGVEADLAGERGKTTGGRRKYQAPVLPRNAIAAAAGGAPIAAGTTTVITKTVAPDGAAETAPDGDDAPNGETPAGTAETAVGDEPRDVTVPDGLNSKDTRAWIGEDADRAAAALAAEEARESPRIAVVNHAKAVLG